MPSKIKVKNVKLVNFRSLADSRGRLIVGEVGKDLPFLIKRIFFIYNVEEGAERARHATKIQEEVIFCMRGSLSISVDDGKNKEKYILNKPTQGLYVGKNVWRRLYKFSHDCLILVLANTEYQSDDHVVDYKEFLDFIAGEK